MLKLIQGSSPTAVPFPEQLSTFIRHSPMISAWQFRFFLFAAAVATCFAVEDVQARSDTIGASVAVNHIGQKKTVCGKVASAFFSFKSRGQPTFLNLDKPYPEHVFTAVIWGSDRGQFNEAPEKAFREKRICVAGLITTYRGKPQIRVNSPSQIELQPAK